MLQIVDSIASSPTVILDLNNESPFGAAQLDVSPPQLRYTSSSSMLVDGARVSQSSYANRELHLTFDVISTSQDNWAASFQTLARAIDQERFWLKYQPTGMTNPVFFYCFRASPDQVNDIAGATAYRTVSLTVQADPAAYGLPVDISSFTITNDPSSGTNRMIVGPSVLGTIKGDLETPLLLASTGGTATIGVATDPGYVSSYALRGGFTHSLLARDLTELTAGTDVGAVVSGAGTNYIDGNYRSCSFATTTMTTRLSGTFSTALTPMPGLYRVLLRVVTPTTVGANSADYTFKISFSGASTYYTDTITKRMQTSTISDTGWLVDLGVTQIHAGGDYGEVGLSPAASAGSAPSIVLQVGASLNAGTMPAVRFDELFLIPVATTYGSAHTGILSTPAVGTTTSPLIMDGVNDSFRQMSEPSGAAPFSAVPSAPSTSGAPTFIGGLPTVVPGVNNYLQVFVKSTVVTQTTIWSGRYWPRYLYVRPAST